jgi:D-inositol-3-phosphate glycosyltransferase
MGKLLKIDMISEHASPLADLGGADAGGQNVHVAALAAALGRLGHEVRVFTRRDAPVLPDVATLAPGVTVEHVPAGPPRAIPKDDLPAHMSRFAQWLTRRWADDPPDVAHAHYWMSGLATVAAARPSGLPVAQTFHALGTVKRRHQAGADSSPPQRCRAEAAVGRTVSAIIATCTDEVRELSAYGIDPGRIYVVPCGVDGTHFRPAPSPGRRPGPGHILTIGRLIPRKGVDTVIAALTRIPGATLTVAGGLPPARLDSDPEVRRLRGAAEAAGVADRVTFTGGIPHRDVPGLLRSADVVVSAPWYEPFGMVALEAMACGIGPVVSAVGGHLDTVSDGVTGLLVPPRDPAALARPVGRLLADPGLRARLGAAAARARSRYGWDNIAAETCTVYERLVSCRSPAEAESGALR